MLLLFTIDYTYYVYVQSTKCSNDVNNDSVMNCCETAMFNFLEICKGISEVKKNTVSKKRVGELLILNK